MLGHEIVTGIHEIITAAKVGGRPVNLRDFEGNKSRFILSDTENGGVEIQQIIDGKVYEWRPNIEIKNSKDALNFLSTQGYNRKNKKGGNDK